MSPSAYQVRTGHFISHWGVPHEIHVRQTILKHEFAVIEFGESAKRNGWRYATNGMSESPQRHETGHIRTELIACSTLRAVWIISLLDALARYPFSHDTYFSEFDTIPIGQPIDRNRSPFSAILLVQPNEGELASLGTIDIALDETIFVLQVIGIYDTECDFAVERGGEALYSELRARASLRLDDLRKAVA